MLSISKSRPFICHKFIMASFTVIVNIGQISFLLCYVYGKGPKFSIHETGISSGTGIVGGGPRSFAMGLSPIAHSNSILVMTSYGPPTFIEVRLAMTAAQVTHNDPPIQVRSQLLLEHRCCPPTLTAMVLGYLQQQEPNCCRDIARCDI